MLKLKIKNQIIYFLIVTSLYACKSNMELAPIGTVPKRKSFETDIYGGYASFVTKNNFAYTGELIGKRNDTIFILADSIIRIPYSQVQKGKVILFSPNEYAPGFLIMLPSLALYALAPEYGAQMVVPFATILSGIDLLTISIAISGELSKKNYIDWSEGWNEVIKCSRFPYEIPESIDLSKLTGRNKPKTNSRN